MEGEKRRGRYRLKMVDGIKRRGLKNKGTGIEREKQLGPTLPAMVFGTCHSAEEPINELVYYKICHYIFVYLHYITLYIN